MLRKTVLSLLMVLGFGFLFANGAYAAVDISLVDNVEDSTVDVVVNSNGSYVVGVDMKVKFSEDVKIIFTEMKTNVCTMSSNISVNDEGFVSITCLNDEDIEMEGVLASFKYSTDSEEYFFYVDRNTLDVGSLSLGVVENINEPEVVEVEEEVVEEEEDELSFLDKVISFLSENSLYVLGGSILLVATVVGVVALSSKE